jgi:uncharacterized membrane protein
MEELLIAGFVLMLVGALVSGPLGLALSLWSLREVGRLRQQLRELAGTRPEPVALVPIPPTVTPPVPPAVPLTVVERPAPPEEPEQPEEPEEPEEPEQPVPAPPVSRPPPWRPSPERAAMWLAASLGGLLVVVASLLALSVAIERGWLGPAGRVCLALVGGTVLWVGGAEVQRRGYRWLSAALSGAGMGALYGALYAAAGLYDLAPDWLAFGFMCAVTGLSMLKADRDNDRFVALLGLIGGLLTPMLLSTGSNRGLELFAYLTLLSCGSLLVATRRGWWDLIGTSAVGVAGLYLGWASRWHAIDQVPVALLGVLALSAPFAATAARAGGAARLVAWVAALGLPLLALPWLPPIDPMFVDPQTGLVVWRPGAGGASWASAAVVLLPVPVWLASRRDILSGGAGTALWGLLALILAAGWADHTAPTLPVLVAGILAAMLAGPLARGIRRDDGSLLPMPIIAGIGLSILFVSHTPGGMLLTLSAAGVVGLSLLAGAVGGQRWWAMTGLVGAALILNTAAVSVGEIGPRWVAAATLLAYAPLASVPLSRRWLSEGTDPALAAALAGPALFLPLYRAWEVSVGDAIIGMLPALLGAVALLNAAVLVRLYRTDRGSGLLAVFVGVALLGISASIPLQLDRAWLTVAWALEAAALAALSRRLSHPLIRVVSIGLLVVVGVRLLLNPAALTYGTAEGLPILNWTLYTWGLPLVATLLSARWLQRPDTPNHVPALLRLLACALGFMLINVEVSHAFQLAGPIELGGTGLVQGMVRSLSWAAYGGGLLGLGLVHGNRRTRLVGFAVVMLGAAKVFAFDLWSLAGLARVGSAMGLGLTLLTAAFLFERLVLRQPAQEGSDR